MRGLKTTGDKAKREKSCEAEMEEGEEVGKGEERGGGRRGGKGR